MRVPGLEPRRGLAAALIRHVQHGQRAVVLLLEELEPLEEGEAPGVGEQQQRGIGQALARRPHVALLGHAEVALDVRADVLGVPELLGGGDIAPGLLAHRVLQRVDLGQHREDVEAQQQLGQVPGHEGVGILRPLPIGPGELAVVVGEHGLLQVHAAVFPDVGDGGHAAPQSLIESAKVPACSRMTWNWPVFSAYLKQV